MEPLNYCRQLLQSYDTEDKKYSDYDKNITLGLTDSVKFILPMNGVIFEDPSYVNVDERISLPFKSMVLEYPSNIKPESNDLVYTTKNILLVGEDDSYIYIKSFFYCHSINLDPGWCVYPTIKIPRDFPLDRSNPKEVRFKLTSTNDPLFEYIKLDPAEYTRDINTVISLINALSCSNVSTEVITPRKQPKASSGKRRFDDYHILVINASKKGGRSSGGSGSHSSPREHLRRGHIRRLETKSIWVNSSVVNAGVGKPVHKDYMVKA